MIQKGFLKERKREKKGVAGFIPALRTLLFLLGAFTLVAALVYMLLNLNKADHLVWIWIPLIVAGIILILVSQMFRKGSGVRGRK